MTSVKNETEMTTSPEHQSLAALPIRTKVSIKQWVSYVLAVYGALVIAQLLFFNENWQWEIVGSYIFSQVVMEGLKNTVVLTLLTVVFGLVLGVIIAWCRLSHLVVLRTFAVLYIWVMRAMPPW